MKHCIYCGAEMSDEARFCGVCGKPFNGETIKREIPFENTQQTIKAEEDSHKPNTIGAIGFALSIFCFFLFILSIVESDAAVFAYFVATIAFICSCIGLNNKSRALAIAGGCIVSGDYLLYLIFGGLFESISGLYEIFLCLGFPIAFIILVTMHRKWADKIQKFAQIVIRYIGVVGFSLSIISLIFLYFFPAFIDGDIIAVIALICSCIGLIRIPGKFAIAGGCVVCGEYLLYPIFLRLSVGFVMINTVKLAIGLFATVLFTILLATRKHWANNSENKPMETK